MTEEASSKVAIPRNDVTFLFTDIEKYTDKERDYPDQTYAALLRHNDILRGTIEFHGGYVFNTGGDSFCAAFHTATEALQAALTAQRALFAERWPEPIELRVRMGLHTGPVKEQGDNYSGYTLAQVKRVMDAGHGGQTLLSDATYNLVLNELRHLEPGAELWDLGEHHLKGLTYPEHIFQLVVPNLPKKFPPLRTRGRVTPPELVNLDRRYGQATWIGGGGFADVYLVRHQDLHRDMALKVPKREFVNDEQFVARFKREARSGAQLDHTNIVRVYDAGEGFFEERKTPYMLMEHVSGGTLRDVIKQQRGPLLPSTAVELALQTAMALEEAHESGIIHRDIKPENIFMTRKGSVKVGDFGIASAVAASSTLAVSNTIIGTPHYMSPEQAEGERAGFRSDLYSLGIVLYEMLTGEVPYNAETPWGVLSKHIRGELRPPKEVNPNVPERVNAATARLLARSPEDRYPDAATLIEDLEWMLRVTRDEHAGTLPASRVRVPYLIGKEASRVSGALAERRLTLGDREEVSSDTVPEGEVVGQNPEAETEVPAGSLVSVAVSSGPSSFIEVPDLTGLNGSELGSTLAAAGLWLDGPYEAPSDTVPEGEVIGQHPRARTEVKRGSSVRVTVSSGSSTVRVPDLMGQNRDRASSMLAAAGLELGNQREVLNDEVPEGDIFEQYPTAGTEAARGSSVSITIGLRPRTKVTVPNLIGQKLPQARDELARVGLKLGGENEVSSETAPKGDVIGQLPLARTEAERGSPVRVTVSKGPRKKPRPGKGQEKKAERDSSGRVMFEPRSQQKKVTVPDLAGQKLPQARDALARAGLKLGGENEVSNETVPKGDIIGQLPLARRKAERGSPVRVTVSSGPEEAAPGASGGSKVARILVALIAGLALIALVVLVLISSTSP